MLQATDEQRVLEIDRYRVLLEPPRPDLVALVDVAAQIADVPLATINLITDIEQHQIATTGFDASVCAREDSMCNVALAESAPIIVSDASQDPRFKDNPFVTGILGEVRFYATHQLRTPDGVVIGTLCVFDVRPREISDEVETALVKLADRVVDLLELELRTRELTQAVEDLERTRVELERSNKVLTAFAGQVSHDLRNPLSAVRMSLDLLEEELQDGQPDPHNLEFVLTRAAGGTERMQLLIDDLLAYARVGGSLASKPVDLVRTLREVREDLAGLLGTAHLAVGDLPTVTGDPVQLRAVFQNLVANAAKFVRSGEQPHIEVRAEETGTEWRITVVDRGLGVPVADRERVFQPLARVHHDVEGSGIGLATVRRVLDAHHGRIHLEETPGGGTTAVVHLPR